MSAKKLTKKKKTKAATTKKKGKAAAKPKLPRKQDVPGYSTGVLDLAKWPEVARVLKVRPFYKGPRFSHGKSTCRHEGGCSSPTPSISARISAPWVTPSC
jgi:hypothetical protein